MGEIKNLEDLLKLHETEHILKCELTELIGPNENYGSTIRAVEITISNEDNQTRTIQCVAKMCPTSEWLKNIFSTHITFRKEVTFYDTIVPMLQNFQKEHGMKPVSFIPKCLGCRVSLDPKNSLVDDDAVILLENLKFLNYDTGDRMIGFDFEESELIIRNLATFHALPIALKLSKPEYFKSKLLPLLEKNPSFNFDDDTHEKFINKLSRVLIENKVDEATVQKVQKAMKRGIEYFKNPYDPTEPFSTMCHNDFWVNNTMLKYHNGKLTKNAMVDFQMIGYNSFAHDLVFFLYTSVQSDVLEIHYEKLLQTYYDTFIQVLEDLKCDVGIFTKVLFMEEINKAAKNAEVFHVLFMLKPLHVLKTSSNLTELNEKDILRDDNLSEGFGIKVTKVVKEFVHKHWI